MVTKFFLNIVHRKEKKILFFIVQVSDFLKIKIFDEMEKTHTFSKFFIVFLISKFITMYQNIPK